MKQAPTHEYSRIEWERRFLLARLPASVDGAEYVRLRDRFFPAGSVRLCRVERPDGVEILTKLTQKTRDPAAPDDPRRHLMTTIYLQPGQSDWLRPLEGEETIKAATRSMSREGAGWSTSGSAPQARKD